MRSGALLLLILAGCDRAGANAASPDGVAAPAVIAGSPTRAPESAAPASASPAEPGVPAASAPPVTLGSSAPSPVAAASGSVTARGFRIVDSNTGRVVLQASPEGRVTGAWLPTAVMAAPGRLVIEREKRVFELAADGSLRDGDTVFGRFIDDHSVALEPWMQSSTTVVRSITLRPDGTLSVVGVKRERSPKTNSTLEKEVRREALRVEGADPATSREVLFVYCSEGRAALLPGPDSGPAHPDPDASSVLAGIAYGAVAAIVLGDIIYQSVRPRPNP